MIGSKVDLRSHGSWVQGCTGGFPERSKGSDCKSDGIAFAGSNPAPPIRKTNTGETRRVDKNKTESVGEYSKRNQLEMSFVDSVPSLRQGAFLPLRV